VTHCSTVANRYQTVSAVANCFGGESLVNLHQYCTGWKNNYLGHWFLFVQLTSSPSRNKYYTLYTGSKWLL